MINKIKEFFSCRPSPHIIDEFLLPRGIQVLVFAPHPDDFDAIAVTLKRFLECGSKISLAVISGAASGVEDSYMLDYSGKTKAELREEEQVSSCLFFGLSRDDITFLHLQEDEGGDPIDNAENFQLMSDYIIRLSPDIIFLPHGNDSNPGHVRTYRMCKKILAESDRHIFLFLNRDPKTIKMRNDVYSVFGQKDAEWKAELLRHHKSQHQRNLNTRGHGFDERILAVNREIATELKGDYKYAEVFEIKC